MKLVTFSTDLGTEHIGCLLDGGRVVDFTQAAADLDKVEACVFTDMTSLIEGGAQALELAHELAANPPQQGLRALDEIRLKAPIPVPPQMRDFLSFELHLQQSFENAIKVRASGAPDPKKAEEEIRASGRFTIPSTWYAQPIYYKCNRFAVSGPEDEIRWPSYSQIMDYELEIAAIIGKKGADIARGKAREHIFGYTIFNDFSARDAQMAEMEGMLGPAKGKDFDGANAMGPCIVTADEIGDPYDLTMLARVNGEEWSRGTTGTMHWKFEDMIRHVSRSETLYPGEILGSGTVGNGCGVELMKFLKDGDIVELEIEKIGILRNRITRKKD